ncbi:efflux RND transporter periplasmic adaptor subunit [Salinimicrobium oceani]|uniref:Efflux RND transporter periplasmic adaptor subunit n=1 Tax=Salinimicrobium oceani TaxID=2722702 RepID=A0ABX1D0V8_9FLAO|nr:efflux RND transporter periplasmic adaptor subunit [Salinimicrobium oceani]NJW52486.1 efflux RND transporter periplasmic adaptor subunit [Salinimicrobium oceani]
MKTKHFIYTFLLVGLVVLIVYRINANNEAKSTAGPRSQGNATVSGMVLVPQNFAENLSLSGSLEANEQVELRSEISGVVEQINFKEGSKVSKGQVLFKVNDLELRAQLAKIRTAEKLAAENERRAQLLLEKEAISQQEYDLALANLQSARAESQLIAAQLAKATVKAPFSGTIGLRYISEGTYITPATSIANLVDLDALKLTFSIPEKYSSQVKIGSEISFTTSGSSEKHLAKIYAIEPGVDVATRSLKMRAVAKNSEGRLIPGTFANVNLPLAAVDDALMVPTESLIPIQNGKKIFVAEGGLAREVEVQTGARTENLVRVISGLKPGDTILTSGVMILKNGAPVKVELRQPVANSRS